MSLCTYNILQINNNINFSLFKRTKIRVFGTYKALRYSKLSKHVQKTICNINSNLNKWIISNEINLKYISLLIKENIIDKNEYKSQSYEKLNKVKIKSVFENKNLSNFKKNSSTFKKKNVLIKPIMIEDVIFNDNNSNDVNNPKNEIIYFSNNNINSYKYYNYYNYNFNYDKNVCGKILNNKNSININKNNNKSYCFNFFPNEFVNNYNNKNIKGKLYQNSHSQDRIKNSAFCSDKSIFNNLKIPQNSNVNINSNYIPYYNNTCNQFKNNQTIEIKKKPSKKIFEFKKEKKNKLLLDDKNSSSMASFTAPETVINNNEEKEKPKETKSNTNKGRKLKNSDLNKESKHTKYSTDNMMRKIKNKAIESSRLLINKIIKKEFISSQDHIFPYREFRKIKGAFSQELNIKYNFWFYQIKIKEIFCLEISNKYTAIQKSSNKELIDYLYSDKNKDKFIKSKKLLDMPFHQYYHDIFLGEDEEWKKIYGVEDKDNIYQLKYLLKNLEEDKNESKNDEKKYVDDINLLALNYEKFFLEKKPRNLDYKNKKNEFIKTFMINLLHDKYLKLAEETKKFKEHHDKRKNDCIKTNEEKNSLSSKINKEVKNNNLKDNQIVNGDKIINNKNEDKTILDIYEFDIINKNNDSITKTNINLKEEEEEKQENIHENTFLCNNKKIKNGNKKEINKLCGIKRKHGKIRYFISCKKAKKIDDNRKFLINKLEVH